VYLKAFGESSVTFTTRDFGFIGFVDFSRFNFHVPTALTLDVFCGRAAAVSKTQAARTSVALPIMEPPSATGITREDRFGKNR
jgi:hypothetical protein